MHAARKVFAGSVFVVFSCLAPALAAGQPREARALEGADLRSWRERVDRMLRDGDLRVRQIRPDTMIEGRQHVRFSQHYEGVPVFGGELAVQVDGGHTLTVFGTLYEGIDLETRPLLSVDHVERIVEKLGAVPFGSEGTPALTILPTDGGRYALTYRLRARTEGSRSVKMYFIDARSGEVVLAFGDIKTQSAVGAATGVLGDRKKISTSRTGSTFLADDKLRPPMISTYDYHGDLRRVLSLSSVADLLTSDLANDSDNVWTDGANVDAHVYAGYVYDYYFERFGRRGLDNANIAVRSITHPVRREDFFLNLAVFGEDVLDFYLNAAYLGDGVMLYGEGLPPGIRLVGGRTVDYWAAGLDVVGHELTHGVTDFSSRLIYRNESGALDEAFSDIMGTAVEFYFQPAGSGPLMADYLAGEDVITPGGFRSLQNPAAYGDPDHYSRRYLGPLDNGGVHTNSAIASHAFYLAIEGGTNRVSGVTVEGVGGGNRDLVEKAFYRAFTAFLTPAATFSQRARQRSRPPASCTARTARRSARSLGRGPRSASTEARNEEAGHEANRHPHRSRRSDVVRRGPRCAGR